MPIVNSIFDQKIFYVTIRVLAPIITISIINALNITIRKNGPEYHLLTLHRVAVKKLHRLAFC